MSGQLLALSFIRHPRESAPSWGWSGKPQLTFSRCCDRGLPAGLGSAVPGVVLESTARQIGGTAGIAVLDLTSTASLK